MNKEDITRMAREAGWPDSLIAPVIMAKLTEFAALVAAAEREACAKVCEKRAATGECYIEGSAEADGCAAAIRARGERP